MSHTHARNFDDECYQQENAGRGLPHDPAQAVEDYERGQADAQADRMWVPLFWIMAALTIAAAVYTFAVRGSL